MAGTAAPLQKESLLKKALEAVEWAREEKNPERNILPSKETGRMPFTLP